MSVAKARMTDVHEEGESSDNDDVKMLDIIDVNDQKAERMGRLIPKIFAMSEETLKKEVAGLVMEVIRRESTEQRPRPQNPFDEYENSVDGISIIDGQENRDEEQQSRIASLEEELKRLKEDMKAEQTRTQAELEEITTELKSAEQREKALLEQIESRGDASSDMGEKSEIGLGPEIQNIKKLGEGQLQRIQNLFDVVRQEAAGGDKDEERIASVSSPGKTTAEQMMSDDVDETRPGLGGYKRMSAAEATKFQERSDAAQNALSRICKKPQMRATPAVRSANEMNALLETIKKKAQEKCSGSAKKKEKVRDAVYTEVGLFIKMRDILADSGVDRGVLIESLNKAESYVELATMYADAYEKISGDDLDHAQKKESNIEQRKEALMRQDDQIVIAVVENGLAPLSILLEAACDPRVFESDRGKNIKLAQKKSDLGSGLLYLLEAVTHLCQASWEKMRLELEDLLSLPRVVENVANESIERMYHTLEEKVDDFEKRHGRVDSEMIRGFMLLTMIKNIGSVRLKESLEDLRKRNQFESTPQDLKGAVTEAKKAVNGMIDQERNHADDSVRNKVNMQLKSIPNALEKVKNEKQQTVNVAAAKGYTSGMEASVNIILGKEIEKDTARDDLVMNILKDPNNKMASTRAKRADELREIVSIMERIGRSVSSSAKTQVDEKDRKTLASLGNSLDEIRGMLTGNGRKDHRGRGDAQPSSRNAAGGTGNSSGDLVCRFWSTGKCTKGTACKFKHPDGDSGEPAQGSAKPTCATDGCDKKCGKQKSGEYYKHCYDCGKKTGNDQPQNSGFVAAPGTDIREPELDSIFDEWEKMGVEKPVPQINEKIMFHATIHETKLGTCDSKSAMWGEIQAYITDIDAAQITIAHNTVRRMMGTDVFSENEDQIYLNWDSKESFAVNMGLYVSDMLDEGMEFSESVYEECERAWSAFKREKFMENMQVEITEIEPDGQCMFRALSKETNIDLDEIKAMARDWILKNPEKMMCPHDNQTVKGWIADEMKMTVKQYAEKMANTPTFWGGPPELKAMAENLGRQILVYTAVDENDTRRYNEVAEYGATKIASTSPIRLLWSRFGGGHYELMKDNLTPNNDRKESEPVQEQKKGPKMTVHVMKEKESRANNCEDYTAVRKRKRAPKMTVAPPEIVYSNRFMPLQAILEQEMPDMGEDETREKEETDHEHGQKKKEMSPSKKAHFEVWKTRRKSRMDQKQVDILNQAVKAGEDLVNDVIESLMDGENDEMPHLIEESDDDEADEEADALPDTEEMAHEWRKRNPWCDRRRKMRAQHRQQTKHDNMIGKMNVRERTSGGESLRAKLRRLIQMRSQERASKHELEMRHGTARERIEMDEILNPSSEKMRREEDEIEDFDFEAAVNKLRNEARQYNDRMQTTTRLLELRIDKLVSGVKSRICADKRIASLRDLKKNGISLRVILKKIRHQQMRDDCLAHMKRTGITLRECFETVKSAEMKQVVDEVMRRWTYPEPSSQFMALSAGITRLMEYDAEKQEYILPAMEMAKQFLQCYKVAMKGQKEGVTLNMFDTGATLVLSDNDVHFPIELEGEPVKIAGIGSASVTKAAPQVFSVLNHDASGYITMALTRGYRLKGLGFAIIPSGPLERMGFEFRIKEEKPYFLAPPDSEGKRQIGYLIKDYFTGLTWIAERAQARPTVLCKRKLVEKYKSGNELDPKVTVHEERIGEIEVMPQIPDTKHRVDELISMNASDALDSAAHYNSRGNPSTRAMEKNKTADADSDAATTNRMENAINTQEMHQLMDDRNEYTATVLLVDKAEQDAAKRVKPVFVKIPTHRMLDTGTSEQCTKFLEYWHAVAGHLSWETLEAALDLIDGGEFLKAILKMCRDSGGKLKCGQANCDACSRMKTKTRCVHKSATTRPREPQARPTKVYIDASGRLIKSVYNNFQYYLLGVTDIGFLLVQFMTYKSQSLFQVAKMFNELGGAPKQVGLDGAGELKGDTGQRFFDHHGVQIDDTVAGHHHQQGKVERPHDTVKTMSRCCMAHAGAPREFWPFAVRHMVLTANLLLRAKDPVTRVPQDKTMWQAHYGMKPDIRRYLVGPWGCLAYVTLTKEARMARGYDKAWSPRAIGGVFLGCYVNPRTNVYHFMIHDGLSIVSTTADLRVVGDCFPLRWQRGRDVQLRLMPPDHDEPEDEDITSGVASGENEAERHGDREEDEAAQKGKLVWAELDPKWPVWPCLIWPERNLPETYRADIQKVRNQKKMTKEKSTVVFTLGDRKYYCVANQKIYEWNGENHKTYIEAKPPKERRKDKLWKDFQHAIAEATEERRMPGSTWPDRVSGEQIHAMAMQAIEKQDKMASRQVTFAAQHDMGASTKLMKRFERQAGQRKRENPDTSLHRSITDHATAGPIEADKYLVELEDDSQKQAALEDPLDFEMETSPDEFDIEEPYDGARWNQMTPVDFSDPRRVGREAKHPAFKLIGRVVRKRIARKRPKNWSDRSAKRATSVNGRVADYNVKTAMFRIVYDDKKQEHLDLVNLKQILVMDKWKGDLAENHGATRQELADEEIRHALLAEICNEYVYNAVPTNFEDMVNAGNNDTETKADSSEEKARSEIDHEYDEVARDDEPRNKAEADRHRCVKCRKKGGKATCEKCTQEREGIYECWRKELKQMWDLKVFDHVLNDQEIKELQKKGHKILSSKMVTKRKYEAVDIGNGKIIDRFLKFKGRLAAVGTREVKGVDMPWSTFSPVVGITAIRTFMSMVCDEKYDVNAYDLSGAFLGADLGREVYMKLPQECGDLAGKTVKLNKAIYGLKTSCRDYVEAFNSRILSFEYEGNKFERLFSDSCIYRMTCPDGREVTLCAYVDDLICAVNSSEADKIRKALLDHIREQWAVTDEGPMTRFVGLNFVRGKDKKSWSLSCGPYIERVGSRFGLDDGKFADTPMLQGFVITPEDLAEEVSEEDKSLYRSLIGSIGFAATTVRYDIAYAVSTLSRYLMNPNKKVIEAAKRVVRYLLGTKDFKITWSVNPDDIESDRVDKIWGAVDASFASDPITRRSHSGYLIFNNGGCISWKSGLQKLVTLSSCESEYVGLCSAVVEICYLRRLADELGRKQPEGTILWEDNKACIILAEGETTGGGRSKHIDIKFRYIAENVKAGHVRVRYIPTSWNYADMMTKPLGKIQFKKILDICMCPETKGLKDIVDDKEERDEMVNLILI